MIYEIQGNCFKLEDVKRVMFVREVERYNKENGYCFVIVFSENDDFLDSGFETKDEAIQEQQKLVEAWKKFNTPIMERRVEE